MLSAVRAIVEHPFPGGEAPVWFREGSLSRPGEEQWAIVTLFALANLLARKRLLPCWARCARELQNGGVKPGIFGPTVENRLFFIMVMTGRAEIMGCSGNP